MVLSTQKNLRMNATNDCHLFLWTHRHSDPSLQALLFLALDLVLLDSFSLKMGDCKDAHVAQAREKLLAPLSLLFWMFSTGGSRSSEEGLNGWV
jgi:hypothetical protein